MFFCINVNTIRNVLQEGLAFYVWYWPIYISNVSFFVLFVGIPQPYKERGALDDKQGQKKACQFSRALLGSCSGDSDPFFGFKEGKPCIIVKLNRIISFRPRVGFLST